MNKPIGRPKKKRFSNKVSVGFSDKTYGQISAAAERLDLYISDIIRECVANDLPRLIERKTKADKRAKIQ